MSNQALDRGDNSMPPYQPLSPETMRRVNLSFGPLTQQQAAKMLVEDCGTNLPFLDKADSIQLERYRYAALKVSDGDLLKLIKAISVAKEDWRDLLVAAGFAHDPLAHRDWLPERK